ncbi:hypothetical protein, partial [Mycobacterium tuberculosis]
MTMFARPTIPVAAAASDISAPAQPARGKPQQ